jgi:hypothetical protein
MLVATEDHAIPPTTQEFMAARAHAQVYKVKASHVLISQPGGTLKVILAAARRQVPLARAARVRRRLIATCLSAMSISGCSVR